MALYIFGPPAVEPQPADLPRVRERRRLFAAELCAWWSPGAEFCGEPAELRQGPRREPRCLRHADVAGDPVS